MLLKMLNVVKMNVLLAERLLISGIRMGAKYLICGLQLPESAGEPRPIRRVGRLPILLFHP